MTVEPRISAEMVAGGRTVSEPKLSPDAATVVFSCSWGAQSALVSLPTEGGPERILTTSPAPPRGRPLGGGTFDWLPDGSGVVYAGADGNLWRQPITGGAPTRLTDQSDESAASCPAVSPDGVHVAFVVGEQHIAVVPVDGSTWPVRLSSGSNDFAFDPSWSADSAFVAWHEWDVPYMAWDESRWTVAPADGSGPVASMAETDVQVQQPRFAPVGSDLAYLCDRTGFLNLWLLGPNRPHDVPVAAEPFEHGMPTWGGGQVSFTWSPDAKSLVFNRNEGGFGRLCVVDIATGELREVAKAHHGGLHWRGDTLVAVRSGGVTPHQVVAYNTNTWERRTLVVGPTAGFEGAALREPEPITLDANDGTVLRARLYRPRVQHPNRPLICWIHGGPTDQWPITFNPRIAYFADRGWTVLVPDHRGSTGHGRAYTQAMRGGWGAIDSADVIASIEAVIARGECDPARIVLMGGSAGGFTVLNVLADRPDLCAAAVAVYPVSDLVTLAEGTHRFEAHYTDTLVGPLPGAIALATARSPLHRAASITTPTLVLHGTADKVVNIEQSRSMAARCSAIELHEYPDEGHGWRRPATTLDELARAEQFLHRYVR
jgi:dipeptidyl aminopeptidase/acylaminoacyl peptidase